MSQNSKANRERRDAMVRRARIPQCLYCHRRLTEETATLEHLVPVSRGGERWNRDNMALACATCNCCKGNRTLEEWLADLISAKRLVDAQKVMGKKR
jgi:5-methylcytosine-specific restriction endonuclease McrA